MGDGDITGTLKYVTGYTGFSNNPELQEGNYLVVSWADGVPSGVTSLKLGLSPSYGSGMKEVLADPDQNMVFRVHDNSQKVKMIYTNGTEKETKLYSLKNLVLEGPTE